YAWVHDDAAKVAAWHGSFAWLPKTGTVSVELVVACPPNQNWVPSTVVATHHSPLRAPFPAPVRCSTNVPSSLRRCQRLALPASWISSPACPDMAITAFSPTQHR